MNFHPITPKYQRVPDMVLKAALIEHEMHQALSRLLDKHRLDAGYLTLAGAHQQCFAYRELLRKGTPPTAPWHLESEIPFIVGEMDLLHEHAEDCRLASDTSGVGKDLHVVIGHTVEML